MLYVLRHYHTFIDLDPGFRDTLRNLAFLPRKDMFLTTDRFYDPDSDLLQKLFIGKNLTPSFKDNFSFRFVK